MSVGEVLATARADAGMSLEDVARATRIRGQLVAALERDDFAACGGGVYARGHIRAVCTALGIDSAPLIAAFDRAHSEEITGPGVRQVFEHEVVAKAERTGPNWTAAMAVAAAILLVIAVIGLFTRHPAPTAASTVVAPSAPGIVSSRAPAAQQSAPTSHPTPGVVAMRPGVSVVLRIIGSKSWVHAAQDGKVVFQDIVAVGQSKEFTAARQIQLTLGNAGAVDLVVNGRHLGAPGANGSVVHLVFTPADGGGSGSAGSG